MTKLINIKNINEIDPKALTLLGASTKRDDESKIGFFGSGLKYAIAVLVRLKIPFRIFSGLNEIKVETKSETFRGQEFDTIYINGEKTSLTAQMGPTWKPWYAIREIYCNSIDEQQGSVQIINQKEMLPEAGQTNFFIEYSPIFFEELFNNWDLYFCVQRKDLVMNCTTDGVRIYWGGIDRTIIYRRGIQCYELKKAYEFDSHKCSLYHYDIDWATINESRELSNEFDIKRSLPEVIAKNSNIPMIKNILENILGNYEETLWWTRVKFFNNLWLDVINNRWLVHRDFAGYFTDKMKREEYILLPTSIIIALQNYFKTQVRVAGMSDEYGSFATFDLDEKQQKLIDDCLSFLSSANFKVMYPVKLLISDNKEDLSATKYKTIYLSPHLLEMGKKKIISTILHSAFHLDSQCKDNDERFDNYLMNKFVSLLEEKSGVRL